MYEVWQSEWSDSYTTHSKGVLSRCQAPRLLCEKAGGTNNNWDFHRAPPTRMEKVSRQLYSWCTERSNTVSSPALCSQSYECSFLTALAYTLCTKSLTKGQAPVEGGETPKSNSSTNTNPTYCRVLQLR
jgi:hypothetical protein